MKFHNKSYCNQIAKLAFFLFVATGLSTIQLSCSHSVTQQPAVHCDTLLWQFGYRGDWYHSGVCASIHSDLFRHGLIEDPFFGDNEKALQWIGEQQWHYRTRFDVELSELKQRADLVFEGLDTRCSIILNDTLLGYADNMYREWVFDVTELLQQGENKLELIFYPVAPANDSMAAQLPYAMPDNRVFTRKAPYHSGWDWGPKYETCGIWKPAYLRQWDDIRISEFSVETKEISDDNAEMLAEIVVESATAQKAELKISYGKNQELPEIKKIELQPGYNRVNIEFGLENPAMWQCNQLGKANLYRFRAEITTKHNFDTAICVSGIRTVRLVSEPDSIGQSFYFELNGSPVFAKGANWIPMESFPHKLNRDKYRSLLLLARDAGFNMLRVWGGGYYEDDAFYEICDSLGIMVWQDFMFACAVYPGDEAFRRNVEAEARHQVRRLRHHPCLVLWCGNNEVSNGWNDWGWQQSLGYNSTDSASIWHSNRYLFEKLLPEIVQQNDGLRSYWPSSPMFGWGHPENNTHGDAHYWGVWWGKEDFEMYYEKTGRFMSEYGFQGMPSLSCLRKIADSSDLQIGNPSLANHQKHPFGFENIDEGLQKYLYKPSSFHEYVYLSQVLQATAMQIAFDAHFSLAPRCMGSLFWQYNDCWPSISWSAVDYDLNPKALYYTAKRMFGEFNLCVRPKAESTEFYIFSNHRNIQAARAELEICDFSGKQIAHSTIHINIVGGKAVAITSTLNSMFSKLESAEHFLRIKVFKHEQLLCSRAFFFERDNHLKLPEAKINISKSQHGDSIMIHLESDKLARWVALEADNLIFADNYFDLLPGETRCVSAYVSGHNRQEWAIHVYSLKIK